MNDTSHPEALLWVRHAESRGNLANSEAEQSGAPRLELSHRDPDMPLSERGCEQAAALGAAWQEQDSQQRPNVLLSSPYERAMQTAQVAAERARWDAEIRRDERLRERDLGILDGFTKTGILEEFPQEAERRKWLGKFYYRPPGGESWADVAGRVRSVMADVEREYGGQRVALVTHQAVILLARYVLEALTEQQVLDIDRHDQLANTSVTRYRRADRGWALVEFNDTSHLDDRPAPVTDEPDATTAAP
jgi:broad specificity phosphatase PhoE